MVATITALYGQAVMANWEAAIAVAVALAGLWIARMRMTARRTVPERRVGYGLAALLAIVAVPGLLPVAAYHWGYLTFLGAAFVVLGLRSGQRLTWISGGVTAIVGVLTGSAVARDVLLGIQETSTGVGPSVAAQTALGLLVLLLAVRDRKAK